MSDAVYRERLLKLRRLESFLIRALLAYPETLDRGTEHRVRYALRLAQLTSFQPGAARQGGRTTRPDVQLRAPELARFRNLVAEQFSPALLHKSRRQRLERVVRALERVSPRMHAARTQLLQLHQNDFSEQELDDEIGIKTLVSIAGGGGGAGYVYVGAWELLQQAGLVPGYIVGTSIGAVLGLFRALGRDLDFDEYRRVAGQLRFDDVFRVANLKTRFGLPGVLRLFLRQALGSQFERMDGRTMRLPDLEIPFEAVVAGVRRGALGETPEQYARSHHLPEDRRPGSWQMRAQIASQIVQLVGFFNPMVAREIVLGADALTREFDCIDAAGFSASVPGILHYDVHRSDAHMQQLLEALLEREEVEALVDGGIINNVPARVAYERVEAGRIGTRNCYYLAFDCLHPQTSLGHVWLQPISRMIGLQVALNRRYMDTHLRFRPTLSPVMVVPGEKRFLRAMEWGRRQMAEELPRLQKAFEVVHWVP